MSYKNIDKNINLREVLAEARAIHLAMRHGAMTYEQAKQRTKPLLAIINVRTKQIAKEFNVRAKEIKFSDLNRDL